jgi:hypothetical protein
MASKIFVEIAGDASNLARSFGEANKSASAFHKGLKVASIAATAALGGLAIGLEKSVHAAMEGQVSEAALDTALQRTHQSLKAMTPALEAASAAGRKLGFTDDETRTSLAKLEIATGSTKKSITDLALAEDIARLKHVDLDTATKMLTGTLAGSSRAAKQLGISVIPVTSHMDELKAKFKELGTAIPTAEAAQAKFLDKQATGQATLQAVTDKVHGQADAYSKTAAGGMAQFHAQTQHLEEALGTGLLPALTSLATLVASGASALAGHTQAVKIAAAGIAVLAGGILAVSGATAAWGAITAIAAAATSVWSAAQFVLDAALTANPIGVVVVAIAALVGGLILAYRHSETFRAIVTGGFNEVKAAGQAMANFITVTIPAAFQTVLGWLRSTWPIVAMLVAGPFAPIVALATNAFGVRDALVGAFNAAKDAISNVLARIVGFFAALPGRMLAALGDVGHLLYNAGASIIQGLLDGLTSKLKDVEDLAKSIGGKIAGLKGPISADLKLLVPHGQAIIEGLQTGMQTKLGGLLDSVATVAPSIQASAGSGVAALPATVPVMAGGGGGVVNNYHVNVTAPVADHAFADYLVRILQKRAASGPAGVPYRTY